MKPGHQSFQHQCTRQFSVMSSKRTAHSLYADREKHKGFALPMAMGLGLVMLTMGVTTILLSQHGQRAAWQRNQVKSNLMLAEGGIARTLAQLSTANNAVLLNRNYDTINPETGKTHLGPDGILNSGDEESSTVDEWSNYDPSSRPCHQLKSWGSPEFTTTGSIGTTGSYRLKAYRYDPQEQVGRLLIESTRGGYISNILLTIFVEADLKEFPGITLIEPTNDPTWSAGVLALRGRVLQGSKANVYYHPNSSADPSLIGRSAPGDSNRSSYLNAIWSSTSSDGATGDTIQGEIFACTLRPHIPNPLPTTIAGTAPNSINTSMTLAGTGGTVPTLYQIDSITLSDNHTLTVDTTGGPVWIEIINSSGGIEPGITLSNTAKILNIRTDGTPPLVGDLRIIARWSDRVTLHDQTCIQDAFLWFPYDELRLLTTGPGCPSGDNTNVEGVVWMEAILSSKNMLTDRDVNYLGNTGSDYDTSTKLGVTSGITVAGDVRSLIDILKYIDWPARYRFNGVKHWQRALL